MSKIDHMTLHLLQLNVALLGKVWKLKQHMWKELETKCKTQYEGILGDALHMYQTQKTVIKKKHGDDTMRGFHLTSFTTL